MKSFNIRQLSTEEIAARIKILSEIGEPHIIMDINKGYEIWQKLRKSKKKFKKSVNKLQNSMIIWRTI